MTLGALRAELVEALRRVAAAGLVLGTAGNASARDSTSGLVAVSPARLAYETLTAADVAVVDRTGRLIEGAPPSVELPLHLGVLAARPDVGAVVHTHSPYATALACVEDEIQAVVPELVASAGGAAPVAEYAPTGTAAMADAVLAAAGDAWAVVMRNHGPVCLGRTLADALACAFAVEEAARIYVLARLLGEPAALPKTELQRVAALASGNAGRVSVRPGAHPPRPQP